MVYKDILQYPKPNCFTDIIEIQRAAGDIFLQNTTNVIYKLLDQNIYFTRTDDK